MSQREVLVEVLFNEGDQALQVSASHSAAQLRYSGVYLEQTNRRSNREALCVETARGVPCLLFRVQCPRDMFDSRIAE